MSEPEQPSLEQAGELDGGRAATFKPEAQPWDAAAPAVPDTPSVGVHGGTGKAERHPEEPWNAAECDLPDTLLMDGRQLAAGNEEPMRVEGGTAKADALSPALAPQAEKPPAGTRQLFIPDQKTKAVVESAHPEGETMPARVGVERPADPKDADDVMRKRVPGAEAADAAVLAQSRRQTRRAFLGAAVGAAAGYGFYAYLNHAPENEMQPGPLRDAFNLNAKLNREVFRYQPLAPTYPLSRAETLRINGIFGLKKMLNLDSWRLQVVGVENASQRPGYAKDVTAWNYRYHGSTMGQGENHDSKEAPKADANGETPGHGGQTKGMPNIASSIKMAPMPMVNRAMEDEKGEGGDDKEQEEDDNHLGRRPRGQEESGESDSTLRAGTPGLLLTMADVVRLPRHEFVTQFKCIEGWSQIVRWAGVRMADFLEAYPPAPDSGTGKEPKYVYMETPDGDYYTGYDLAALRHPQALLVTEMMGMPLQQLHGAPLRLHMPTKYGYKQIKRIALIAYTSSKPDDYWTKLGYDWYADL